jgi:hypothetical protein
MSQPSQPTSISPAPARPAGSWTIVSASFYQPATGQTQPISGIPAFYGKRYGLYTGSTAGVAAKKALTGIFKHLKRYPKSFPDYKPDGIQPEIVFIIREIAESLTTAQPPRRRIRRRVIAYRGEPRAFLGQRVPHKQGARQIVGPDGRTREYHWASKVREIPLSEVLGSE